MRKSFLLLILFVTLSSTASFAGFNELWMASFAQELKQLPLDDSSVRARQDMIDSLLDQLQDTQDWDHFKTWIAGEEQSDFRKNLAEASTGLQRSEEIKRLCIARANGSLFVRAVKGFLAGLSGGVIDRKLLCELDSLCVASTSDLSNYVCLRPRYFLSAERIESLVAFLNSATIRLQIEALIPDLISVNLKDHPGCSQGLMIEALDSIPSDLKVSALEELRQICVLDGASFSHTVSAAFSEEVQFRFCVQDRAFRILAKFLPKRFADIICHPVSRITIASLIFAFAHTQHAAEGSVFPQFLGGLVYGCLYERFGILASTMSHSMGNLWRLLAIKANRLGFFESRLPGLIELNKLGKELNALKLKMAGH